MKKSEPPQAGQAIDATALKRELEKGLASGVSKRSPEQIRTDSRKAREAV